MKSGRSKPSTNYVDRDSPSDPASSMSDDAGQNEPKPIDAYQKALGLLVRREHSRRELERKLRAKGADAQASDDAIEKLELQGYQNDARFAEMLVRTRIGGGYGPLRIRAELGMHQIESDVVAGLLADAAPDWHALASDALRRRYGGREAKDRSERVKRSHYLMRRGFDADSIRAAVSAVLED
jgi:regulatory protein